MRVPHAALLTPRVARECAGCGGAATHLSDWQALTLKLLHERALGSASLWSAYLAVLPSQPVSAEDPAAYNHPLLWPPGLAQQLLEGSLMLPRYAQKCAECDQDAQRIRAALRELPAAALPCPPSDADVRLATALMAARAFHLPGVDVYQRAPREGETEEEGDQEHYDDALALVPWADSINHCTDSGSEGVLTYDAERRVAVLRAHRAYRAGEQVFDSYGNLPPVDALLDYGFVERPVEARLCTAEKWMRAKRGDADRADLPAGALGPVRLLNSALLGAVGLPACSACASMTCEGPDQGVMAWARAASATDEELLAAGWSEADAAAAAANPQAGPQRAYVAMGFFMKPFSAANEWAALSRLRWALQQQANAYPAALSGDVARLRALEAKPWKPGRHHAELHALRAVVSERRAVEGSLQAVQHACDALGETLYLHEF